MNQPKSLQAGTRIDDYEIKDTLWTTNSGFIYLARELDRDRDVLIQEYLPPTLADRHWSGIHAMALEGLVDEFDQGLTRFLREARILAQINDPYVCRVYEYTEANATAYMALDYEPGQTLKEHLAACRSPLDEGEIRKLLVPLLKGLRVVHGANLLHRDINPANIYLRDVGPPVLIGFGTPAATPRDDGEEHVENRVAPGYSPVEQYQSNGEVGPWSDLYALGATMYRCLSGAAPVDAACRVTNIAQDKEDPLVPATELGVSDYSAALLSAIDWMMEPMAADRPASAGAVLGPLTGERSAAQGEPAPDRGTSAARSKTETKSSTTPQIEIEAFRDRRPHGIPAHRAPPPARNKPATHTPVRPLPNLYRPARPMESPKRGWKRPLLVVLAGVSLLAFFVLYEPAPTQDVTVDDTLAGMEIRTSRPEDAYPPPEIPDTVKFGRDKDNERAAAYRDLEQQTDQIEQALAAAEENMKQGQLVSPAGDNALVNYRAVLAQDPDHTDARLGITAIQTELVKAAESAFEAESIDEANRLLGQAREIAEESDRARALGRDIEEYLAEKERQERLAREEEQRREEARQRAEQERREEIQSLVARADSALQAGRLTRPPGDNALAYYRDALRLEPGQPEALRGVERIGRSYLDRASDAIAKDELEKAEGLLSTAAAILPDNESIPLLEKQLETRRAVAERERRDRDRQVALAEQLTREQDATGEPPPVDEEPAASQESRDLERGIAAYYTGDYDIAYRLLNPLAEQGDPRAKFRVAMMHYYGRGVERNTSLATTLVREALPRIRDEVRKGAAWAQADLGSLYADGIVVAENDKEAVRLYTLAAEQGYAGAQTNLGVMYANGEGVLQNRDNAIAWLQRAAAQGDRIAQQNLQALGVQ